MTFTVLCSSIGTVCCALLVSACFADATSEGDEASGTTESSTGAGTSSTGTVESGETSATSSLDASDADSGDSAVTSTDGTGSSTSTSGEEAGSVDTGDETSSSATGEVSTSSSDGGSSSESGTDPSEDWALSFSGIAGASSPVTNATLLEDTTTIELWVRRTGILQGVLFDTRSGDGTSGVGIYQVDYLGATHPDNLVLNVVPGGVSYELVGPDANTLQANVWHALVVILENDTMSAAAHFYVDGERVATQAFGVALSSTGSRVRLGSNYQDLYFLENADLDNVRIMSGAAYEAGETIAPDDPPTVRGATDVLWTLDEGQGNSASDDVSGLELEGVALEWVEH